MDTSCNQLIQLSSQIPRLGCSPYVRVITVPNKLGKPKKPVDECVAKDSLDRALSSCYDQHRQFWAPRSQVVMQCDTYRLFPMGRALERLCNLGALPETTPPPCGCSCASTAQQQGGNCRVKRRGKCGPCSSCNFSGGGCGQ